MPDEILTADGYIHIARMELADGGLERATVIALLAIAERMREIREGLTEIETTISGTSRELRRELDELRRAIWASRAQGGIPRC